MSDANHKRVTVLGAGNMGEAIVRGLFRASTTKASYQVIACDRVAERLRTLQSELLGLQIEHSPAVAVRQADVIVLATKPGDVPAVLEVIRPELDRRKEKVILLSVAAGVRVHQLKFYAGDQCQVVRCMPNLPATVGAGMTAVYAESENEWDIAREVLANIGDVERLSSEAQIDVATALSAGGPAFACLVLEALADGGVKCGLPRDVSYRLALGMLGGTAKYLEKTALHPAVVRERVSSPGGTTIAGLAVLEQAAVRAAFISAIDAATERAQALGKSEKAAGGIAVPQKSKPDNV